MAHVKGHYPLTAVQVCAIAQSNLFCYTVEATEQYGFMLRLLLLLLVSVGHQVHTWYRSA
jgi:hypothetical protein